ncbi:hypothetical protein N8607_00890 [bacterium]|nr:hypothetical protein [bacterium]
MGPDVEVINLGCLGYGSDHHYWTLIEHGLSYGPDVVLLTFVANDIVEAERSVSYEMEKPRFVRQEDGSWVTEGRPVEIGSPLHHDATPWRRMVRSSALLTLVTRAPLAKPPSVKEEQRRDYERPSQKIKDELQDAADKLLDPASPVRYSLERLAAACTESGLPVLGTHVPHKHEQFL